MFQSHFCFIAVKHAWHNILQFDRQREKFIYQCSMHHKLNSTRWYAQWYFIMQRDFQRKKGCKHEIFYRLHVLPYFVARWMHTLASDWQWILYETNPRWLILLFTHSFLRTYIHVTFLMFCICAMLLFIYTKVILVLPFVKRNVADFCNKYILCKRFYEYLRITCWQTRAYIIREICDLWKASEKEQSERAGCVRFELCVVMRICGTPRIYDT